jgi:hypothetical protein
MKMILERNRRSVTKTPAGTARFTPLSLAIGQKGFLNIQLFHDEDMSPFHLILYILLFQNFYVPILYTSHASQRPAHTLS